MKQALKKIVILCGLFMGSKNICLIEQYEEGDLVLKGNFNMSKDVSSEELNAAYERIISLNSGGDDAFSEIYGDSQSSFEAFKKDLALFGYSVEFVGEQNSSKKDFFSDFIGRVLRRSIRKMISRGIVRGFISINS